MTNVFPTRQTGPWPIATPTEFSEMRNYIPETTQWRWPQRASWTLFRPCSLPGNAGREIHCAPAPAQLVSVDMSSGSSAQGPMEMAWSWKTGPLDGHRFLQSFRKAAAGSRGWQRESQGACGLRDHSVTAWCETGRQKSSWEPDARCVSGM